MTARALEYAVVVLEARFDASQENRRAEHAAALSEATAFLRGLTPRQRQTAALLVRGFTTRADIAAEMGISPVSLRYPFTALLDAAGVDNGVGLALFIMRRPVLLALLELEPIQRKGDTNGMGRSGR